MVKGGNIWRQVGIMDPLICADSLPFKEDHIGRIGQRGQTRDPLNFFSKPQVDYGMSGVST